MMTQKLQQWKDELNAITEEFGAFRKLTHDQFNFKPNPKTWSIGQIVDHIIVLNATYLPILESLQNRSYKTPLLGRFNWPVNFFGKLIHDAVEPSRKRKGKTLPLWEPTSSKIDLQILDRFDEQQHVLIDWMFKSEDLLKQGVVINSPANSVIVYKLEKAFDIIVTHERRHLNQAKELLHSIPVAS